MKTLDGFLGANGKPGKIDILVKGGEKVLQEFSTTEALDGSTTKCYVLTAPGDIISVDITAGAHTADVFDLEVDGVLRASLSSSRLSRPFHGTISKVCFKAKTGKKGGDGPRYCAMQVKSRDESMDATFDRDGTPSSVSRLTIKAWRKDTVPDATKEATPIQVSWDEYTSWKELKHYIKEGPKPPFEMDFVDSTKLSKKLTEKMEEVSKRNWSKYFLVTTFIFELQSTSSLTALGFENVPVYVPTAPTPKPPRAKKEPKAQKSQVEVDNEDEDDCTSTIGGLNKSKKDSTMVSDSEDEGRWVPKSKTSKEQSAEPKPKPKAKTPKATKPKAATLGLPPTTEEILKSIMPYKPTTTPSKEEVSKSLSFSRANLFPPLEPARYIQNSSREGIEERAALSTFDVAKVTPTIDARAAATPIKGLVLHGEVGGPARRAGLARGEPQEIDSQPSQVDLLETIPETTKPFLNNFTAINHKKENTEVDLTSPASPVYESPAFEPLTPPASTRKALLGRDDFESVHHLLDNQIRPLSFPGSTTASIQDVSTQSGTSEQELEPTVDLDKVVKDLEAMSQRAASPALSDATEVADPMEIMESVRNSQRDIPANSDFQREITDYYQNVSKERSGGNESPTLRRSRFSDVKSGDVRDQVRESWQQKSPTPSRSSSFRQEKRKADACGEERLEGGHPQKLQKTAGLEQKMMVAKAKLAAATERNVKLERERRVALEVKKQNDEVEALLRKAEEMEQTNDELEAEINALNESNLI